MGELTAKYLVLNGVHAVIVSNRSYEKAVEMAAKLNGQAIKFGHLAEELKNADIVISCTAANHYVIREDKCSEALRARQGKSIILIDIAVPRDIDPALSTIDGVHLYDIDDLQGVINVNFIARHQAAHQADDIIDEQLAEFNEWMASLYVVPVIAALKKHGEIIKQNELQKTFNKLGGISPREQKIITTLAHSIVNQLLHYPVVNLKEMAVSNQGHLYAEVVKKLFNLQLPGEEQDGNETIKVGNQR